MLLLYRDVLYKRGDAAQFTFHYASTLSIAGIVLRVARTSFTFHYASTLSFLDSLLEILVIYIYIPLCFYFIISCRQHRKWLNTFTFHYASTLSEEKTDNQRKYFIYIPLCFYFIQERCLQLGITSSYLHSTMLLLYLRLCSRGPQYG